MHHRLWYHRRGIAYKLPQSEPDASIVVLEARQASSGASGRNGGHCRAGRYLEFADELKRFGKEDALRMEALEEASVKNVAAFMKEHDIQCDLRDVDTVDIFTDLPQWEAALESLNARKEVFDNRIEAEVLTKHRAWSSKETREELLVPEGLGAISFPAHALHPYKLVISILEMCTKQGMNLQTNTPVVEVSKKRDSSHWTYQTHAAAGHFGRENWGEDGEVVMEWTGIMGYTQDKQPVIGEAPGQNGLYICAGFHGHGMSLTFQCAKAMTQILLGKEKEVGKWLPSCYKISRVPKIGD